MSLSNLFALARRHFIAVGIILLITLGIAVDFRYTPPAYAETAVVALGAPIANQSVYKGSLIMAGQIIVMRMSGDQGRQELERAGVGSDFSIGLINVANLDQPLYPHPYLQVSTFSQNATTTHSQLVKGLSVVAGSLAAMQAGFRLSASAQITMRVLSDSGPVIQVGSRSRTYAGLAFLALVATYLVARSLDNGLVFTRRRGTVPGR